MLARNLSTPARPPVAPSCGFLSNMAPARSARLELYKASYRIRVSYLAGARRPAIHHRPRRCSAAKSCRSRIIVQAYLSIFRAGAFMAISLNRFSATFALIPMQSSDPFLHVLRCLQIFVFQQVPTLHNRFMTLYHNNNNVIIILAPVGVRSIAMSVSVCLFARISQKLHVQTSRKFQ